MDTNGTQKHLPAIGFLIIVGLISLFTRLNIETFGVVLGETPFVFELFIAGTIIAILRNEAGISTFGVFGPVIISFAWIALGPIWGLLLFLYILILAILVRLSLDPLEMGTPHRIAIILVTVGIGVIALEGISNTGILPEFEAVILFPLILSAWYGDRFISHVRDTSWQKGMTRLLWTLLVITIAYALIAYRPLVTWIAQTPETWLLLVALNVYLGYRSEFRLSEYLRFDRLRKSLSGAGGQAATTEILQMRVRNRDFIGKYNPEYLLSGLTKTQMKQYLHNLELATPATLLVANDVSDLKDIRTLIDTRDEFVIKPSSGAGGEGILVVRGRTGDTYQTSQGELTQADIVRFARTILEGKFAAGYDTSEQIFVEELIRPSSQLRDICGIGVPDVRVIVLQGIPIMAMTRLPTRESNGTANLHGGAVGVALSIADGEAGRAFQQTQNRWTETHPDTGKSLSGVRIDEWDEVLRLASKSAAASHLGYAGVDIVFDEEQGPLVLEVNRRPGLGIQNVNMSGLLKRLRFVEAQFPQVLTDTASEKVRKAREWDRQSWDTGVSES